MPDLSSLSHLPLKVIFAIHLILVTWSLQGHWCPKSTLFYNLLFFLCLLWAIQNIESDEPIQLALLINVLSIFLDIITVAVYFPPAFGAERFSVALMIINMLARCVTSVCLLKIGYTRGGSLAAAFPPSPTMGFNRQEYEDIPHPIPQNSDFAAI